MQKLKLRPADARDLPELIEMERTAFQCNQISRRSFKRFLSSPTSTLVVAVSRSTLVGYALVLFSAQRNSARLYSLAVSPDHNRKGIGTSLLAQAERAVRQRGLTSLRLEVEESNAAARRLYVNRGYAPLCKLTSYYDNGGDALRFEKKLSVCSAYECIN